MSILLNKNILFNNLINKILALILYYWYNKVLNPTHRRLNVRALKNILDSINKNDEALGKDCLNTLMTIATLMNEVNSGRFHGAEYKRTFTHGRLNILISFNKK